MGPLLMEIWYTDHALKRIRQRRITREQVEVTINEPHVVDQDKIPGRRVANREFGRRRLKVVYAPTNSDVFVITAYWIEAGGSP